MKKQNGTENGDYYITEGLGLGDFVSRLTVAQNMESTISCRIQGLGSRRLNK